jgi:hypothetical protein
MQFYVNTCIVSDTNKLTKTIIEKIIENYFPKEPYFFCSKNLIKCISVQIGQKYNQTIFTDIYPNTDRIYKLRINNIIEDPIYCLFTSRDMVSDVIAKIKRRYKKCSNGTFTSNSTILDNNTPLDKCNLSCQSVINEIIFNEHKETIE